MSYSFESFKTVSFEAAFTIAGLPHVIGSIHKRVLSYRIICYFKRILSIFIQMGQKLIQGLAALSYFLDRTQLSTTDNAN